MAQSVFGLSLQLHNLFVLNNLEKLSAYTVQCLGKKPAHNHITETKISLIFLSIKSPGL